MALGKPTPILMVALNELTNSAEPEVVKKHSAAIATIKFRLQKLDKLEEQMTKKVQVEGAKRRKVAAK